jgi:hypothetical protein
MTEASEIPEETALYHIFGDEDLLLYIGISKDFGQRWKDEAKDFPWWDEKRRMTTDWYPSRPEASAAERAAIKAEKPKYNKQHNGPYSRPARAVRGFVAAQERRFIPVRIPDDEGAPVHPLDFGRRTGPRLPGQFTMMERTLSDPDQAEAIIARLPEESREYARIRLEGWRVNYKVSLIIWETLRDLCADELTEDRPEVLAKMRSLKASCRRILEIPCPCCNDAPPAGMACSECAQAGPDYVEPRRRLRAVAPVDASLVGAA